MRPRRKGDWRFFFHDSIAQIRIAAGLLRIAHEVEINARRNEKVGVPEAFFYLALDVGPRLSPTAVDRRNQHVVAIGELALLVYGHC